MAIHKQQPSLAREVENAKSKVTIGARYQHYKSNEKSYQVLGFGFLEANDELCVIYRAEYGERLTFLRPLTSWLEQVEWDGKVISRFTIIG